MMAHYFVFGLTQPGLKHTIYHNQREHTNHYNAEIFFHMCGSIMKIHIRSIFPIEMILQNIAHNSISGTVEQLFHLRKMQCDFILETLVS